MFWTEDIAARCTGPQVVNDSKTPSGRVHVGALRGVLIHDAIFRTLRERGIQARYLFGVDDYDPVDEIPKGEDAHFGQYLGRPLCETPAPGGSKAPDMAEHFMAEFWQVFDELGVQVERYRMRDVYRSGRFNEPIDRILRHAAEVRRVYKEVSNSDRPAHWHPFQVICEKCGCIGTTEVSAYDGREVTYFCHPGKVVNAKLNLGRGCGYEGKVSPFDGRGKLPWKLEWVAKWVQFPVTIEGAGKDHSTKGGSRDVSEACLRAIYPELTAPLRVPYEFFLVGGAKMSSSRGVGASARDMADLLPPDVLRFLMIRTKPNSPVNFDPREEGIVKLFNEFDRYQRNVSEGKATPDEACVFRLAERDARGPYRTANFQLVTALVQMPHLEVVAEVQKRAGRPLTAIERQHLDERIASAKIWVERYASEEEKTRLQETLPARAQELTATQRAFLHKLAEALPGTPWEDEALQSKIFEVARLTPIEQPVAFEAIYRVLLDRAAGPKAGNLLAFLEPVFVLPRFRELAVDRAAYWRESAVTRAELEKWIEQQRAKIAAQAWTTAIEGTLVACDFTFTMTDGKQHVKRLLLEGQPPEEFARGLLAGLPARNAAAC
jgi:lysyl-tRNA synthetase class 1